MKALVNQFCLLLISVSTFAQPFDPVNRNASPEAKRLLKYLYSINGRQLLSGQHNFNQSMHRYDDSVYAITGKYPAVWGTDFIWNWKTDNGQAIVDECIRRNKEGYIITLMWHQGRPTDDAPYDWKKSIQGKLTDEQWKELTTEGTPLYKRWLAQIDVVAGYLGQLNAAHVPVLWRPYHEMNGIWFWWGNKKGKDGIAKLWKMMYDRYVNHFHLNNLLWVWGANGPRDIPGDEAYAYKDFYPGHEFVDILGTDVYHMDYEQKDYDELLGLAGGKPIALTECGELPSPAILDAQPKWSWFLVWSDWIYSHNSPQQVRAVYDRPQTVTHEQIAASSRPQAESNDKMHLNSRGYLEYEGVNVMLAQDFYPEGHQGGVGVIQHGQRVATNGDIRLEPTPGQWQPIPKVGQHVIDRSTGSISVHMEYPDETKDRKGFNPIIYPDLHFSYTVRVEPAGVGCKIIVDLDSALPAAWVGKVGFNFELYPGVLFGRSYYMDSASGIFPQQPNGPHYRDRDGEWQIRPMATGRRLVVAPESDEQRMSIECLKGDALQLIDGRGKHNNGWFVVRSLVPRGAVKGAVEWLVTPHAIKGWMSPPTVQVSQVGYHPLQEKIAVIELDAKDRRRPAVSLVRIGEQGSNETVLQAMPHEWGDFLRYHYLQFDFTSVRRPGMYVVQYGDVQTNPFQIGDSVYVRNVWQPTLEYFLPAQMCHMRVNDKYRVWHGYCHMDDARMAPVDSNHFDGYIQGHSTLTSYHSGETVPGLNAGAWHDAGDFDLRVESQAETVYGLTLAYEAFKVSYDNTSVDQRRHLVEIQQPDGKPDMLQQIEHGLLSIVGGYKSMGRFYRGIIEPALRQYTILGDAANITDNKFYDGNGPADDRWVFTEDNPGRALEVAAALAAARRVMKGYNDTLADDCLRIAQQVWNSTGKENPGQRIALATELYLTTKNKAYADFLVSHRETIARSMNNHGWVIGRALPLIHDSSLTNTVTAAAGILKDSIVARGRRTPYGVPYQPNIWGAGWDIQHFGAKQYFLHQGFPAIFSSAYMLAALNFILGCHPGGNTASFASGVGAHSMIPAYGFNRADWSYIPGGIASGTALIRPDFPELLPFPYLWQQGEYVLGGGTTDYLLLVLAADQVLNARQAPGPADSILARMRYAAKQGLLDEYYPRNIDTLYGGYLSTFSYDFTPVGPQDKMIVTQARHVWSTAKAAMFYHDTSYIAMSRHGFYFLRDKMWDPVHGGFYTLVTREGVAKSRIKEAYGNAFGIYALSAYYECSKDTAALGLAKRTFMWLEKHSHDPVRKGYFQHLEPDGTPVVRTAEVDSRAETGYKDQNSSIHLLEAFTALYHVWPDPLVRQRLQEMLVLIRDRIVTPRGNLQLFFTPDWRPVSFRDSSEQTIMQHKNLDHVSFGHDVETAYLLREASEALGLKDDRRTFAVGKKMVDHALRNGWDTVLGGFYDEGYYFKNKPGCTIINKSKNWWAQAEGLNTLLIFSYLYPHDPMHYRDRFIKLWQYVQTYMIDHEHGDWYEEGLDNEPQRKTALKAHIWKGTYHCFRALSNCIGRLSADDAH